MKGTSLLARLGGHRLLARPRTRFSRVVTTSQSIQTSRFLASNAAAQSPEADSGSSPHETALSLLGPLDVRRFDMLVHKGPADFGAKSQVAEVPNEDLDWSTTIFHTVTDPNITARLQKRFGQRPLWSDQVVRQACELAVHLPGRQYHAPHDILAFVENECVFKNEHADGGFVDHLDYCAEYCARYFPGSSPNVLWLHSICGVNTNLFPLDYHKLPELDKMLTPHEIMHVHAFPGMLRLLFFHLMDTLWDSQPLYSSGEKLKGITITTFHGTEVTLVNDDFWMHLNYQLVHQLDFLPTQQYAKFVLSDSFTRLFFRLHQFLRQEGKLLADIRLDRLAQIPGMTGQGEQLPTWEHFYGSCTPEERAAVDNGQEQFGELLKQYSKAIDHDLTYQLHWSDGTTTTHTP